MRGWMQSLIWLSPALGPVIGAFIYVNLSWQAIIYFLSALICVLVTLFIIKIPETLNPDYRQSINIINIYNNYRSIVTNKRSILLVSMNATQSIVQFSNDVILPLIILVDYQMSPVAFGVLKLGQSLIGVVAVQLNMMLTKFNFHPLTIIRYANLIQLILSGFNFWLVFHDSGRLLSPYTIMLMVIVNNFFSPFQGPNRMYLYQLEYRHMAGTATSFMQLLRLATPVVLLTGFLAIDRNMGATLLITNALAIIFLGGLTFYFVHKWGSFYQQFSKN